MSYPLSNVLIDSMDEDDRKKLLRHLKPVALPVKTSLYEADQRPKYIHFLTTGIASVVTTMRDGGTTEVGTVGREGAPQGVHLLGPVHISTRCFMQVAGTGLRMDYTAFGRLFQAEEGIRRPVLAYAQYQNVLFGQVAGCNRLHPVEARLARWLLMVQDRTGTEVLKLTQEFLGQMMGTQRTTVNAVAGALQDRGVIAHTRGTVRVLNRKGLEKVACECYAVSHTLLAGLYGMADQQVLKAESS